MRRRVAYLTFGTNGAGHVARGMAVCDALAEHGVETKLFTPPVSVTELAAERVTLETFDEAPSTWRDRTLASSTLLATALKRFAPHHVVVDLFWVPWVQLGLPFPATLLLRSVPAAWLTGPRELRFDSSRFERIWAIEPALGLERFERCEPVVWRPNESPTRDELCRRLGVDSSAPLRLIIRSGVPEDRGALLDAATRMADGWCELALGDSGWLGISPWLATLHESDCVVSASGYNAFWEAHAYGYANRVVWAPCPRRLDDQVWRSKQGPSDDGYDGARRIAQVLCAG